MFIQATPILLSWGAVFLLSSPQSEHRWDDNIWWLSGVWNYYWASWSCNRTAVFQAALRYCCSLPFSGRRCPRRLGHARLPSRSGSAAFARGPQHPMGIPRCTFRAEHLPHWLHRRRPRRPHHWSRCCERLSQRMVLLCHLALGDLLVRNLNRWSDHPILREKGFPWVWFINSSSFWLKEAIWCLL